MTTSLQKLDDHIIAEKERKVPMILSFVLANEVKRLPYSETVTAINTLKGRR